MTYTTETAPNFSVLRRAIKAMGAGMALIGKALAVHAEADSRMQEVYRLRAMSDTELAKIGLTQDRIVHHVFRDVFYL